MLGPILFILGVMTIIGMVSYSVYKDIKYYYWTRQDTILTITFAIAFILIVIGIVLMKFNESAKPVLDC